MMRATDDELRIQLATVKQASELAEKARELLERLADGDAGWLPFRSEGSLGRAWAHLEEVDGLLMRATHEMVLRLGQPPLEPLSAHADPAQGKRET